MKNLLTYFNLCCLFTMALTTYNYTQYKDLQVLKYKSMAIEFCVSNPKLDKSKRYYVPGLKEACEKVVYEKAN